MLYYSLKCRINTEGKNPKFVKTENGSIMLLSKWAMCDNKRSKFIKEQEARQLLRKLTGIKATTLSDLLIANILF